MNSLAKWLEVWEWIGPLALGILAIVGITTALHFLNLTAIWRRTLWQACSLALFFLLACEWTGASRKAALWILKTRLPADELVIQASKPNSIAASEGAPVDSTLSRDILSPEGVGADPSLLGEAVRRETSQVVFAPNEQSSTPMPTPALAPAVVPKVSAEAGVSAISLDHATPARSEPPLPLTATLAMVWAAGSGLVLARAILVRLLFFLFPRRRVIDDFELQERVRGIAKRFNFHRRVRIVECRRLASPVAFGFLQPTIGLPLGFASQFTDDEQNAILAHEVAHVSAADPLWQLAIDLVASALWWHPLVWWARRELREASEVAADEASLMVANGPAVLAECLVKLGTRLVAPRSLAWLGIQGNSFRSGLGRRVERLCKLEGCSWRAPDRVAIRTAKLLSPVGLAAIAILCAAASTPGSFKKGETTMKTFRNAWQRSLALLALASITTDQTIPAGNQALASQAPAEPEQAELQNSSANPGNPPRMDPVLRQRYGLGPANDPMNKAPTSTGTFRIDPMLLRRYGLLPSTPEKEAASNKAVRSGPEKSRELLSLKAKLEKIVFEEISYDGIPLAEVLKDLSTTARARDPEKRGLNFLISNSRPEMPLAIDPITGVPIKQPSIDLNNVIVRLNLPLRHVQLKDVLDAITKVAEQPINYTLQDYGILFSAGPMPAVQESPAETTWKMDPALAARYGLLPANTVRSSGPAAPTKTEKLDQIVIEEVFFDGLPLSEVAKHLSQKSRELDPEKRGINVIISNLPLSQASAAIDPTTGAPVPAGEPIALYNVIVKFNLPLRNVRFRDVLDAITRVADVPLQYAIENWGVVFSRKPLEDFQSPFAGAGETMPPLEVRTFRVDQAALVKGLEEAFGIKVAAQPNATQDESALAKIELQQAEQRAEHLSKQFTENHPQLKKARAEVNRLKAELEAKQPVEQRQISKADAVRVRQAEDEYSRMRALHDKNLISESEFNKAKDLLELRRAELEDKYRADAEAAAKTGENRAEALGAVRQALHFDRALKQLFAQLGVNMEISNKLAFYNPATGILMVRVTADDLKIIQAALETLGGIGNGPNRKVSVMGAVQEPGIVHLPAEQEMDILQVVAKAGGFASKAGKNPKIELSRAGQVLQYRFDDLRKQTNPSERVWLKNDDTLFVPEPVF
jgi:beta-lactamase regulating signal transducer with metallopeptidase domain